jgi:hypothetical protein
VEGAKIVDAATGQVIERFPHVVKAVFGSPHRTFPIQDPFRE